jgi:hypothetical protein
MLEIKVEDHLKDEAKRHGGYAIKFIPAVLLGFPDRMVLLPGGKIAFIELKRPGKEPRKAQWVWINRLRRLGFEAHWFSSMVEITAWIDEFAAK